jgi:hypothetical protein
MQANGVEALGPLEEVERLTTIREKILAVDFEKIQRWTTSQ